MVTWPAATRVFRPTTKGGREERRWERGWAAMLEEWNILLVIELYFYANSSFCFIMQTWLLVTWPNTLYCEAIFPIVPLFPREKTNLNKKAFWQSILGSILWTFYTCNLKVQLLFSARETMATLVKYKCKNFITLTPGLGSKITPSWKWHIARGEITLPLSQ